MNFRAPVIEIDGAPAAIFGKLRVVGFVEMDAKVQNAQMLSKMVTPA